MNKRRVHRLRWALADRLSRLACCLRGHRWYVADAWHGVPGDRVNELRSQIWDEMIILANLHDETHVGALNRADEKLGELAQFAGENWGHIWPKEPKAIKTLDVAPRT